MKTSTIKKLAASSLAVVMVMGSALTALAITTDAPCGGTVIAETVIEHAATVQESAPTIAEVPATSSVAGVATTVPGVYLATSVQGTVVSTPASTLAAAYGLAANEKPMAKFTNFDAKGSAACKQVIDTVAATQGGTVVAALNIELGKMAGGKYSVLPTGEPIVLTVGLNAKDIVAGANYAVIIVRPGSVEIVPAVLNGTALSFATSGGAATYAVIRF